jgi:protein-S-isoprenylcysteine O-methyltransferase Ste14
MVTIYSLHLLIIGIFFLVVSQTAPFQDFVLSLMMFIGIVLAISGAYFRIVKMIALKVKKVAGKTEKPKKEFPKNYNLTYFLIALAVAFVGYGYMTMPGT